MAVLSLLVRTDCSRLQSALAELNPLISVSATCGAVSEVWREDVGWLMRQWTNSGGTRVHGLWVMDVTRSGWTALETMLSIVNLVFMRNESVT